MLLSKSVDVKNKEYIGIVEDNDDPAQMQRVRVRLPQHPKNMKTEELPWAIPEKPGMFGSGNPAGTCIVPQVNSFVRVILCYDQYNPVYTQLQTITSGNLTDNYPNMYGFQDPNGNYFKMNMIKNLINVLLKSEVRIEQTGDIKIKLAGNLHIAVDGLYLKSTDINITSDNIITNASICCPTLDTYNVTTMGLSATQANIVGTFKGSLKGQASQASVVSGNFGEMPEPQLSIPEVDTPELPDLDFKKKNKSTNTTNESTDAT